VRKEIIKPKIGDTKIVKKYLYFPKTLAISNNFCDSRLEWRWLEFVMIRKEYTGFYGEWRDVCWENK